MEIIVPCAGLSSRFPGMRPKYLLTDYSGQMMIEKVLSPYLKKYPITITILEEHDQVYQASHKLKNAFNDDVNILVLKTRTRGPADTVYQTIKECAIASSSPILIKDSDSFYDADISNGNKIYVCNIHENSHIQNLHAKSYTITNEQDIIINVIEKKIVSNNFCAGGYQFESAKSYCNTFVELQQSVRGEIFISHIIDKMINDGSIFIEQKVSNIVDVGTLQDWLNYNNRPSYFCDIDGVILKNKHPEDPDVEPLQENVNKLLQEQARGCKIIFATARPKKFETITKNVLNSLGFQNYDLIMAINHSKRILINDFSPTIPYPSAVAINLPRDMGNLYDYL